MTIQPSGAITGLPTGAITDQVFSPDGHTLYTARNGIITAYDISTGNVVGSWAIGTQLGGIDISADGHSIVAVEMTPGGTSGTWPNITAHYFVYQLDLASGSTKTFDLPVTGAYPEGYGDINFLSDGTVLIAGGGQWQPLTVLNLGTGATTITSQTFEGPTLTSAGGDSHILVSPLNISDAPLFMYTVGSGITASHQSYADNIMGYNAGVQAISPDGSLSVEGVSLAVYDSNLHLITKLSDRFPFGAAGLAFSPDGTKLYVLDPVSNEVFVLSTSNWDVLAGYPVGAPVTGTYYATAPATHYGNALLVSSDGTHLAVDCNVSVQIIDLTKVVSDAGTSAGNDTLVGDSTQNVLYGFEGNDTLDGKAGADAMYGGPGDDIYYADNASDNIIEKPNEGTDTVYSSIASYTLPWNVETLVLSTGGVTAYGNSDANHLVGNVSDNQLFGYAGDDILVGGAGNDVLYGGTGNDTLQGGSGNDTYYVDSPADIIQENVGEGIDKIFAWVSYTLSTNVENLELSSTGYPLVGQGNALDNVLIANGPEDALYGVAGNDTLIGAAGSQYLSGGLGSDTLTGGADNDTFIGTAAELNGDRITDFTTEDRIVISDANVSGFTFSVNGSTLAYGGGSLTLGSVPTGWHLVASTAAEGGVQLTLAHNVSDDVNGDGRADIIWRNTTTGDLTDWLGQANGSFAGNTDYAWNNASLSWHIVGTGDFNGDGHTDILWQNDSGEVTNWLGNANGGFTGNIANADNHVDAGWQVAGTGDVNGDGRADIIWRNTTTGDVTDWLGQANGSFAGNTDYAWNNASTSWHIVQIGDFNGDGNADILWQSDSGEVTNWLGNANGGFNGNIANADNNVDAGWHAHPQAGLF